MKVTYIGHLTHLFEDGDSSLLMDPLLTPTFGHEYSPRPVELYPPRSVDPSRLAAVTAVLVTHEHFDHFNLESLSLLERSSRIIVGPVMLNSVERAIQELGFHVERKNYYETYELGDLQYTLYPAAPDTAHWEKRVSQIFVRGRSGGSILLGVDALFGEEAGADALENRPTLIAIANNAQVPPPGVMGALTNYAARFEPRPVPDGVRLVSSVLTALDEWPALVDCNISITGGGFRKDYDEIGVFPLAEQNALAELARSLTGRDNIYGPMPGDVYELVDDSVTYLGRADFVNVDEERLRELTEMRSRFIADGGVIARGWVIPPAEDDVDFWPTAEDELNGLARFMLLTDLGADVVELSKVSEAAMMFRLLDEYSGTHRTYRFDAAASMFVYDESLDSASQDDLCLRFSYGVVLSLSDFRALVEGNIQIWDLAGVAVDAWYSARRLFAPLPLMYTWWGEQTVQPEYEGILKRQLDSIREAVH